MTGLLAMTCLCAWAQQDGASNQMQDYDGLKLNNADNLEATLDGQITLMEGHVDFVLLSNNPEKESLPIKCDKITFEYPPEGGKAPSNILLEGHVVVKHPSANVNAQRADWNFSKGELVLTGTPEMSMPNEGISGIRSDKFIVNFNDGTLKGIGNNSFDNLALSGSTRKPSAASDPSLLTESSIADWQAFLTQFKAQCLASEATPGKHILGLFKSDTPIASMTIEMLMELRGKMVKSLNKALALPKFYDEAAWKGIPLPQAAADALKARDSLAGKDLTQLNRILLEAAYPGMIK